jgi:hypothetical protein
MHDRTLLISSLSALLALGSVAACDGGSPAGDADAAITSCSLATLAADEGTLRALLDGAPWSPLGPYTSARPEVTGDVSFTADVVLDAADLAIPQGCAGIFDCRQRVGFLLDQPLVGVTCEASEPEPWLSICAKIAFDAGTSVRFRATLQDTHPTEWNSIPIIQVLPSCEADCAEGELRCQADNTCWSAFEPYCRLCLEKDKEVCPCQTDDGAKPDGEDCSFMVSGDVICGGECMTGFCDYTGEPGHGGCP